MFSLYTSLYLLENSFIDWKDALDNFTSFGEEVCVATTTDCKDRTIELLQDYQYNHPKVKLVITDFKLDSPFFDGQLKNAALKQCTQPFCILLDADERLSIKDKQGFINITEELNKLDVDACFIPVIDLYNTEKEYKSLGNKWYLHKNKPNINRGIVNFAKKESGKIDINKSDTCELIYDDGSLVYTTYLVNPSINDSKLDYIKNNNLPVIYHLGWLDKEKRLKSNQFWQPVWNARAGHEVTNIIHSKEKLDKIEFWPHGLKLWYE